jgi:putative intracellular protease/amidase
VIRAPASAPARRTAGACIAAVCHGPAGLLAARDASGGAALVAGRRVAAFTAEEERAVGKDNKVPARPGLIRVLALTSHTPCLTASV